MKRIQPLNTKHTVIAACLALSLAACSPKIDNEGYISETPLKEQVTVGKTTRDQVKDTFGSPSSQSTFGDETWYYITDRKEGYAFLKPDIVQQNVTSITFDNAGIVTKIENYTKKDAEDITLVKRTTPTRNRHRFRRAGPQSQWRPVIQPAATASVPTRAAPRNRYTNRWPGAPRWPYLSTG
jgi:outer membrane protein assembly factor BamE (lipoprotein component of BamABCDE complex)